jgi:hypothetical protein
MKPLGWIFMIGTWTIVIFLFIMSIWLISKRKVKYEEDKGKEEDNKKGN